MSGRGTKAIEALRAAGLQYALHEYAHDPDALTGDRRNGERTGYGLEAAAELGVEPGRVFKTLVANLDGRLVLGVVPVTGELDLGALAKALGGKRAAMAERSAAERATGYVIGGISPLGGRRRLTTVLDTTATTYATIFVSGGRRGLDVELSPADLVALTGALVAQIARR
jgi:Cys-tRNA(Pro)/Cys-tRNA(Cys) deacylase